MTRFATGRNHPPMAQPSPHFSLTPQFSRFSAAMKSQAMIAAAVPTIATTRTSDAPVSVNAIGPFGSSTADGVNTMSATLATMTTASSAAVTAPANFSAPIRAAFTTDAVGSAVQPVPMNGGDAMGSVTVDSSGSKPSIDAGSRAATRRNSWDSAGALATTRCHGLNGGP